MQQNIQLPRPHPEARNAVEPRRTDGGHWIILRGSTAFRASGWGRWVSSHPFYRGGRRDHSGAIPAPRFGQSTKMRAGCRTC